MVKILIKLKEKSIRNFLVTQSGYTVTKEDYAIVDDSDRDIQSFINNRNDILLKDYEEVIKGNEGPSKEQLFQEKEAKKKAEKEAKQLAEHEAKKKAEEAAKAAAKNAEVLKEAELAKEAEDKKKAEAEKAELAKAKQADKVDSKK